MTRQPASRPFAAQPSERRPTHRALAVGIGLAAGFVVASSVAAAALAWRSRRPPPPGPAFLVDEQSVRLRPAIEHPLAFMTSAVEEGPALPRPPVTARVVPVVTRSSASFAPLEGRVEQVAIALGDRVQRGRRLVLVRSGDLASMRRELRAASLAARTRKALVERLRFLVETRAASDNELLVARTEYEEAQLTARTADARLRSLAVAQQGDNLYWIVAARSGTVTQLDAQPGQVVGPTRERAVVTIADIDEVMVLADLPQRDAGGLAPGMAVAIRIPGKDDGPPGRIESVAEVVDPDRQTVPVRVRVDNRARALRPHAFVEAVFGADDPRSSLQVPVQGVVSDGLQSMVFVEVEPGVYRRRKVTLGRRTRERAEVLSGLARGERVVIRGALLLLNAIDAGSE